MTTRDPISVSPHLSGWKKFIGGRRFYSHVGQSLDSFRRVAVALIARWREMKAGGRTEWTEEDVDAAYAAAGVVRRPYGFSGTAVHLSQAKPSNKPSPAVAPVQPTTSPDPATDPAPAPARKLGKIHGLKLFPTIDTFLALKRTEVPHQITIEQCEKLEQHLPKLKKLLRNVVLDDIEYDELVMVRNTTVNSKRLDGKPYSVSSLVTMLNCYKTFFNYLADSEKWYAPRGFDRAMKVDRSKLASCGERDEDEEADNPDWDGVEADRHGYSLDREIFQFGLCLGFTALDIATVRRSMIVREGDDMYLVRKRKKTRHTQKFKTKWWVPPELARVIDGYLADPVDDPAINPKGYLIIRNGKMLVHRSKNGMGCKTDRVRQVWTNKMRAVCQGGKVRRLSHKFLRKTAGRMIAFGVGDWKGAGIHVAQRFLGHSVRSVAEQHYLGRPDFTEMHAAQRAVYAQLKALVFDAPRPAAPDAIPPTTA
jgi:integrase